jgi:hypothetical protein
LDDHGRYAGNTFTIENVSLQAGPLPDRLPEPPLLLDREIQPHLRLLGYERGGLEVATGEPFGLALWWLATRPISPMFTQFALVRPSGGEYIILETQPVHNSYPFTGWQTPQFVIDTQTLTIPADVPAGEYQLAVRFLDEHGERMKRANLGALTVQATQRLFTPPAFDTAVNAIFGNEIQLLGYSLNPTDEAGTYAFNLIWQAQQRPTADYTVFVHLLQPDGSCNPCVWQQDSVPQQGQYPTRRWQAGEVVIDRFEIILPEGTPPGSFPLEVGLYLAEDGRRLQATLPDGTSSDAILLEPIEN